MVDTLDDAELLGCYARERAEAAFAELVRRYLGLVYHAALRQVGGDAHAAEEVSQRVFTLLARKAGTLSGHATIVGWLHTTTRWIARETVRAERRRRVREQEAYLMSELAKHDTAAAEWERLRPVIDEAIAGLNECDREAVLLRFFAGLPLAQVGARLSVSENTARMRVERALEKLQARLVRRGITSIAAALGGVLGGQAATALPAGVMSGVMAAALAPTGGIAAAGAGGWMLFMTASKTIWTAGFVLLLASGGVAFWEMHGRAAARAEKDLAQADVAVARRTLDDLERRVAAARQNEDRRAAQPIPVAATGKAPATSGAAAVALAAAAWDPVDEGRGLMERHRALSEAVIAKADAQTRFRFERPLQQLGLSARQIDAFVVLMREFSFQGAPFGPNGMMYAFPAGTGLEVEETQRRLKEVMGAENYGKLAEVHRVANAAQAAVSLASKLALTDEPVTTEQTDRLQEFLLGNRNLSAKKGESDVNWPTVMALASSIFSVRQLDGLARVRAEQERMAAGSRPMPSLTRKQAGK